jgi:5-methylcytosine-specific restriction protein A
VLVRDGTSRCVKHKVAAWSRKSTASKRRFTGRRLQEERRRLFERDPLCAECRRQGRVSLAAIRDHIKPLAEGGEDVEENTQGLCAACDEVKSKAESSRGRGG